MRRLAQLAAMGGVLLAAAVLLKGSQPVEELPLSASPAASPSGRPSVRAQASGQAPVEALRKAEGSAETTAPGDSPGKASEIPDLPRETYRAEARKNPHRTPPSLLSFADRLAPRMEKALADPQAAETLYPELKACALDESRPSSARSLCAINLGRLARAQPDRLSARFQKDKGDLPEALRDRLESYGL